MSMYEGPDFPNSKVRIFEVPYANICEIRSANCSQVLSWIDEGKLPEQNVESARAVKNSLPWHFLPEVVAKSVESTAAICLCKWMVAIFAYFDAVENWEP